MEWVLEVESERAGIDRDGRVMRSVESCGIADLRVSPTLLSVYSFPENLDGELLVAGADPADLLPLRDARALMASAC